MNTSFTHAVIGGTFDHFHKGHRALLNEAFKKSEYVTIGITQETLYKDKILSSLIEPYKTRELSILTYLKNRQFTKRATLLPLSDIFGNTLQDPVIDAIFVSEETEENARLINKKRMQKGLTELEIITIPFITGEDSHVITSEKIRRGEINSDGHSYRKVLRYKKQLILPENMRETLHQPIGEVVSDVHDLKKILPVESIIIAVGDIVFLSLKEQGYSPAISIIDFKTQRHPVEKEKLEKYMSQSRYTLTNPAGTINPETVEVFTKVRDTYIKTGKEQIIIVDGEEDLIALPALLLAPLGSIVVYGQVNIGMVIVQVTEEIKKQSELLVMKFK